MISQVFSEVGRTTNRLEYHLDKVIKQPFAVKWTFFKEYLRYPKVLGSMIPSSRPLARKMIRKVTEDFTNGRKILEIGAGTGAITKYLIKELREGDHLDVIECLPRLAEILHQLVEQSGKGHQVTIHALPIQQFKSENKYDYVISMLPVNMFPPAEVKDFYKQLDDQLLAENGCLSYVELMGIPRIRLICQKIFSLFNAAPYQRFRSILDTKKEYLVGKKVEEDIVLRNLPPARVTHVT